MSEKRELINHLNGIVNNKCVISHPAAVVLERQVDALAVADVIAADAEGYLGRSKVIRHGHGSTYDVSCQSLFEQLGFYHSPILPQL